MNILQEIKAIGDQLSAIRKEVASKEEAFELEIGSMKQLRDSLQAKLLELLSENGLKTIKVDSGDSYSLSTKKGVNITDQDKAIRWALDNYAFKPDMKLIETLLKSKTELPEGFEFVEKKFISVRKATENK